MKGLQWIFYVKFNQREEGAWWKWILFQYLSIGSTYVAGRIPPQRAFAFRTGHSISAGKHMTNDTKVIIIRYATVTPWWHHKVAKPPHLHYGGIKRAAYFRVWLQQLFQTRRFPRSAIKDKGSIPDQHGLWLQKPLSYIMDMTAMRQLPHRYTYGCFWRYHYIPVEKKWYPIKGNKTPAWKWMYCHSGLHEYRRGLEPRTSLVKGMVSKFGNCSCCKCCWRYEEKKVPVWENAGDSGRNGWLWEEKESLTSRKWSCYVDEKAFEKVDNYQRFLCPYFL